MLAGQIQMRADNSIMTPLTSLAPGSTSQVTGLEEHKLNPIRLKIKTYDPFIQRMKDYQREISEFLRYKYYHVTKKRKGLKLKWVTPLQRRFEICEGQ